jgi:hypothetical protein
MNFPFLFAENDGGGVAILQQVSVLSVFCLLISIKARLCGLSFDTGSGSESCDMPQM